MEFKGILKINISYDVYIFKEFSTQINISISITIVIDFKVIRRMNYMA